MQLHFKNVKHFHINIQQTTFIGVENLRIHSLLALNHYNNNPFFKNRVWLSGRVYQAFQQLLQTIL